MKIALTNTFLLISLSVFGQTGSIRLLPSAEITAHRLTVFSIGQTQMQSDSMTLSLYQNQHLSDYLQAETPLSIRAYGTGLASVATRGMAANHTAILWNGINLQNPLNGLNDMALLDVGTTQRIDVKLGGSSALFGSGAIGGVIYLDNEKPKTEGLHGQLGYGVGSFEAKNGHAELSFNKKKIGGSIRIAQQSAKNDFLFKNTAEIGQPLQRANPAAYTLFNATANLFAEVTNKDFVKINFWQSHNYREITPTMTARNDNAIYRDSATRLVGEWAHFFKKSYIKMRGAYVYDKNAYQSDIVPNSQNGIRSTIGEVEWNGNISAKNTLRVGVNATKDQSNNTNYKENHQRTRLALFINDAYISDFITLTANVRQEYRDQFQPTTFSTGFEKKLFPRPRGERKQNHELSTINYPLSTTNYQLILRGAISRNFNIPTFNDLYWAELGNPNLVSEQGWSKELGLSLKSKVDNRYYQAHLTVFDIQMDNRITWLPQSNGQWRPTNIDRVQSRGIETYASYQWKTTHFQYKIKGNYQFAHATNGKGGVQLFVPAHNGSLSGWLKYRSFYASWQQTASSKRYGTSDKTTWTNPFTLADATVGFMPPSRLFRDVPSVKKTNFDVRLHVSNVFNTDYQVIRFYPNTKRTFWLNLNLVF